MTAEEMRKLIEEAKKASAENPELANQPEMSPEEAREKAMASYLADLGPISQFINEGFAKIDAQAKEKKKEKNTLKHIVTAVKKDEDC